MILKEDSDEMKRELLRKDELIKKHYEKLGDWQSLLQDMQASSTNSSSSGGSNSSNLTPAATAGGPTSRPSVGPASSDKVLNAHRFPHSFELSPDCFSMAP